MAGIGYGKEDRRPGRLEDLIQDRHDPNAEVNEQDAVGLLQFRPKGLDLLGRGDQLVDEEIHVGQFVLNRLEGGLIRASFLLQRHLRPWKRPSALRVAQEEPGHLYLGAAAARTEKGRHPAFRPGAPRTKTQAKGCADHGQLQKLPSFDVALHVLHLLFEVGSGRTRDPARARRTRSIGSQEISSGAYRRLITDERTVPKSAGNHFL